jgi:PTS system nitrogen regulatory IIA component
MLIGGEEARDAEPRMGEGLYDERRTFHGLSGRTREEVLADVAFRLAGAGFVPDPQELVGRLLERERLGCTGLGGGVAIPHCKLRGISEVVVAVASVAVPVDFGAADGIPVDLVFLVASPAEAPAAHLHALARISKLLRAPGVVARLRAARSVAEMLEVLRDGESAGAGPGTP